MQRGEEGGGGSQGQPIGAQNDISSSACGNFCELRVINTDCVPLCCVFLCNPVRYDMVN